LYPEEQESDDFAPEVKWHCFEYITVKSKKGEMKKLMLVKKVT
jgi:hypothetical protein